MDLREELDTISMVTGEADRQAQMEWIVYHGNGLLWGGLCLLLFVREWKQDHQGGRGGGGWLPGRRRCDGS